MTQEIAKISSSVLGPTENVLALGTTFVVIVEVRDWFTKKIRYFKMSMEKVARNFRSVPCGHHCRNLFLPMDALIYDLSRVENILGMILNAIRKPSSKLVLIFRRNTVSLLQYG